MERSADGPEKGTLVCESCRAYMASTLLPPDEVVLRCVGCGHLVRERLGVGVRSHPWGGSGAFDRVRVALTARRLRRLRGSSLDVLELGPGAGDLARRLEAWGHRVSGVEPALLQQSVHWRPRRGHLWSVSAEEADLPESAFDVIIAIHVVEHLNDPSHVFEACLRALRPGGLLYLVTPNASSMGLRIFRGHWWNFEDPTHRRFFSQASLEKCLGQAGFHAVRTRRLRLDSLAMEVMSLARALMKAEPGRHGVMEQTWLRAAAVALLPVILISRFVVPPLSPSMEAWAERPEEAPCEGLS